MTERKTDHIHHEVFELEYLMVAEGESLAVKNMLLRYGLYIVPSNYGWAYFSCKMDLLVGSGAVREHLSNIRPLGRIFHIY